MTSNRNQMLGTTLSKPMINILDPFVPESITTFDFSKPLPQTQTSNLQNYLKHQDEIRDPVRTLNTSAFDPLTLLSPNSKGTAEFRKKFGSQTFTLATSPNPSYMPQH